MCTVFGSWHPTLVPPVDVRIRLQGSSFMSESTYEQKLKFLILRKNEIGTCVSFLARESVQQFTSVLPLHRSGSLLQVSPSRLS